MNARYYVTSAIAYVNGRPRIGHALEFVQVDVLARHRRQRGDEVRFQTGTDDNALKNVQAAKAEGHPHPAVRRSRRCPVRRLARSVGALL